MLNQLFGVRNEAELVEQFLDKLEDEFPSIIMGTNYSLERRTVIIAVRELIGRANHVDRTHPKCAVCGKAIRCLCQSCIDVENSKRRVPKKKSLAGGEV